MLIEIISSFMPNKQFLSIIYQVLPFLFKRATISAWLAGTADVPTLIITVP